VHGISEQTIINYQSGYNSGISYADSRVNESSINYSTGYNNGINYADGRVNTSSSSYNSGYSNGKNIISTLTKGELLLMLFFNDPSAYKTVTQDEYKNTKVEYNGVNQIDFSRISSITIHTDNIGWSGNYYRVYFGGNQLEPVYFDKDATISNGHTNNNLSVVDQYGNLSSYTIKSFTTTDGKVHSPSNLNY